MNSLRLPVRRAAAVAAGLALGLGGALIATAAHAEEITPNEAGKGVVNCSTQTISPDREGKDSLHPWRIVFRDADGVQVMWRSGDWDESGANPDDNPDWAVNDFSATLEIEGLPNGEFEIQWWDSMWKRYPYWDNDTLNGNKYDPWNRKYSDGGPCDWVQAPEVVQPTCESPGLIVVPGPHPEDPRQEQPDFALTYWIDGEQAAPGEHEVEPGTYEITALRIGGVKDYTKKWTVEIEPVDCPTPSPTPEPPGEGGGLPKTGTATTLFAGGAAGLLALGGVLYLAARRRRITFTT